MAGNHHFYHQVSSWSAVCSRFSFFPDTNTLSVIDTCRYGYFDLFAVGNESCSPAVRTFVFDHFSGSMTVGTGLNILDRSEHGLLGIYYLTGSMAFRTGLR